MRRPAKPAPHNLEENNDQMHSHPSHTPQRTLATFRKVCRAGFAGRDTTRALSSTPHARGRSRRGTRSRGESIPAITVVGLECVVLEEALLGLTGCDRA